MSPIDITPPAIIAPSSKLWTPAKPYIIRASEQDHDAIKAMPFLSAIAGGAMRSAAKSIRLTYINSNYNDADLSTYDFGSFTIPRAGLFVVGVMGHLGAGITVSSVSIGGVNTGTILTTSSSGYVTTALAARSLSAGSYNVTAVLSGTSYYSGCHVWLLEFAKSPHHAATSTNSGTSQVASISASLNIPANGVALFLGFGRRNPDTDITLTWSSASVAGTVPASGHKIQGANKTVTGAITPHTETITPSLNSFLGVSAVSWEPA